MTQYTADNLNGTEVEAVYCSDLIKSWTNITEGERDSLLGEILYPEAMLCPNTTDITVKGGANGDVYFDLNIIGTETAVELGVVDMTMIYKADITRYFNAEQYEDDGFQPAITLYQDQLYLQSGKSFEV